MKAVDSSVERFWLLVDKNGPTVNERLGPCWLWTGSRASLRHRNCYGKCDPFEPTTDCECVCHERELKGGEGDE